MLALRTAKSTLLRGFLARAKKEPDIRGHNDKESDAKKRGGEKSYNGKRASSGVQFRRENQGEGESGVDEPPLVAPLPRHTWDRCVSLLWNFSFRRGESGNATCP